MVSRYDARPGGAVRRPAHWPAVRAPAVALELGPVAEPAGAGWRPAESSLETPAWENFRVRLSNRTSFVDRQTGEPLDCTVLYLAMLFEWPGWDRPVNPQATDAEASRSLLRRPAAGQVGHLPAIVVHFLELRRDLGMSPDQKYISPWKLSQAKIADPQTGAELGFITWGCAADGT